jgi:peptide/nickel transport system permease protein
VILDPRARRRLLASPLARLGAAGCALVILVAIAGPALAPHSIRLADVLQSPEPPKRPPSGTHPLGTDWHGLDVLSKVLWGARTSVGIGLAASAVAVAAGLAVGLAAGYCGGAVDAVLMRFVDVVLAFPSLLLAILVAASLEPGLTTVFLALTMASWAGVARLVRSLVLTVKSMEYVVAEVALGASHLRVVGCHVVPNLLPTLAVIFSTRIGGMILSEASLSFLGLGEPSGAASWGVMVFYGMDHLNDAAWCAVAPATAIAITVFSFNLLGDGVRDALDPRMRVA